MINKSKLLIALTALTIAIPSISHADPRGWVGGLFGLSIPNADNTTSRPIYGITGGAKLGSDFGIGAYYLTSTKEEDVLGGKTKFDYDLYGIEGAIHFEGEANGVYLGGRVGTSKLKVGSGVLQVTTSPMHYGLVAGYNHMLGDNFSLGGEANFFSIPESSSSGVTIDGFTMLNFIASAKLWF